MLTFIREVIFYLTPNGGSPVKSFLASLTSKQRKKIAWALKLVKETPIVSRQYFKKLIGTDDIWEVRVDFGNDTFRILGFMDKGNLVILTNAFAKKTEKTPPNEIKIAEQRKKDYESQKNG
ncbi:MAG TPA: type II toxin-antitoxin system RelE/ParE family toxin [Pyrinomonadaceae bacterium]|nr:type II toxin-antitoxin system RelE/ParE family toxin [Pyrinomonadaceae bacterium]